jgi:anti-sigma-K factor RskA
MPVSESVRDKLASGAVFAISVEPAGGSTTGAPTGPVVAAGDLKAI